jgi:hypothetical protein
VAHVQSQGYVYHSCVLLLAKASGRQVLPGADTPFLDLEYCRPHGVNLLAVASSVASVLALF